MFSGRNRDEGQTLGYKMWIDHDSAVQQEWVY